MSALTSVDMRKKTSFTAIVAAVVLAHLVANLIHGAAHEALAVTLPAWKNGFVYAVILVAPLVALALIWRGRMRAGHGLLLVSMAGSFGFATLHHFVWQSADHVSHIAANDWGTAFTVTATATAVLQVFGCGLAIAGLRREPRSA